MSTQLFVDNMADQQNGAGGIGNNGAGEAYLWKDRKCNIALITGITGQVNTMIDFSCHNSY